MQRAMRTIAAMLLVPGAAALAGCDVPESAADPIQPVSRSMPWLTRSDISIASVARPELRGSHIAVSNAGALAYSGAFDRAGRRVVLTDAMHHERARLGPPGEGRGELRSVGQLAFVDSALFIDDDQQGRILSIAPDGKLRSNWRYPAGGRILAMHADSVDVEYGDGTDLTQVRRSAATHSGRAGGEG